MTSTPFGLVTLPILADSRLHPAGCLSLRQHVCALTTAFP
jgi:hypothetical protein